jgi:predicted phage tail component-like protein
MAHPTFENLSLQDSTYITKQVDHDTLPKREIESVHIPRRLGKKLINTEIGEKVIQISGIILADTAEELQSAKDELKKVLNTVEGTLTIEDGRDFTATAERVKIPEKQYTRTVQPFEIQFVCSKPFAEGAQQNTGFVVPSGLFSFTLQTTVSGTVFNRPQFVFTLPSGTGTSPVNIIKLRYYDTANQIVVSGSWTAESEITIDYNNYQITQGGVQLDYTGQFDNIEPGSRTFEITVSGTKNDGTRISMGYRPRYW